MKKHPHYPNPNNRERRMHFAETGCRYYEEPERSRLVALMLCFFLGSLGAHRFYAGKIGTGVLYLFTLGFLGFGALIDLVVILAGRFKDKEGREITYW